MVTIIKRDQHGHEQLRYQGEIVQQDETSIQIRAPFTFATRDLGYVLLKQGDIFTEWFYADRWYNVFMITDVDTGAMKGYYCNLTRPSQIRPTEVVWDDLALDIWVYPDGRTQTLDEDEYETLDLTTEDRLHVARAVNQIATLVAQQAFPFDILKPQAPTTQQ